jgi:hypothetical protein
VQVEATAAARVQKMKDKKAAAAAYGGSVKEEEGAAEAGGAGGETGVEVKDKVRRASGHAPQERVKPSAKRADC